MLIVSLNPHCIEKCLHSSDINPDYLTSDPCGTLCLCVRDETPGGQAVSERFQVDWVMALVSSLGVIAVRCDGRANGAQSSEFVHMLDMELQLKVLRYKLSSFGITQGCYDHHTLNAVL